MDKLISAVRNYFAPQLSGPDLISPLPTSSGDNMQYPGVLNYVAANQIYDNPKYAKPSNFQPKTLQYPSWLANAAPTPQVLGAKTYNAPQIVTPTPQPQANPISTFAGKVEKFINPESASAAVIGAPEGASNYEKQAANIFAAHGVPPEVGLGIWAMEGRGKTINPNNPYNIGAYDSNPQNANAYPFKDPLDGTKAAAQFLTGQSQYQTDNVKDVFKDALSTYKKTGNPVDYLKKISGVYSSNPNYWQTIVQTPEYQRWVMNNN